jgi:hypothetical protein
MMKKRTSQTDAAKTVRKPTVAKRSSASATSKNLASTSKGTKAATKKAAATKRAPTTVAAKRVAPKPRAKAAASKPSPIRRTASRKQAASKPYEIIPVFRRAVFIDVENTSSQAALLEVLESLKIDQRQQRVEVVAVGNWRAVGPQVGRDLAGLGAQLVHSAPARGVRDWSDLWIAVAAGCWIARATPGDVLEIVSNDRAFDAVADAAAAQGVLYHRIQHRRSGSAATAAVSAAEPPAAPRTRGGRRGRRSRRPTTTAAIAAATVRTPEVRIERAEKSAPEPHGASRDQMVDLVHRLAEGRPSPWVNLDVLESALKREGYSRPANSPRLVTRLRRLKDFEVDSHGRVRLASSADSSG